MLAVVILTLAVLSRFFDHAPNFTPTIALALFGGVYLPKKYTIVVPLAFMLLSDLYLGFHDTMFYTWGSVVLISMFGVWMRKHNKFSNFLFAGAGSAIVFFVITNLGAWPTLYPMTWQGLSECFVAAIPFFRNTFVSTVVYSTVLYGTYEIVASQLKTTRWADRWLTTA